MLFQCPKLTPLQSRFLASFSALVLIGIIYWSLSHPQFAYAAELDRDGSGRLRGGEDHNWHRIEQQSLEADRIETVEQGDDSRSIGLEKRQTASSTINGNDSPNKLNITAGNTVLWKYPSSLLHQSPAPTGVGLPGQLGVKRDYEPLHAELRKRDGSEERQNTEIIYVSINTCSQPSWNRQDTQSAPPPQLTLYVSTTTTNTNPGPNADQASQTAVPLQGGYANASVSATGDWYIAVSAPSLPSGFSGDWNYELAVSRTDFYHAVNMTSPFLYLADTDMQAALLVTDNLTQANASDAVYQQWLNLSPPPFIMFAANQDDTRTWGIENSYCGWKNAAQIAADQQDPGGNKTNVNISMITRGVGAKPKAQFYLTNLHSSSRYNGVLAMPGNSTKSGSGVVGGGGKVWQPVPFTTKTDGNCALLFNLTFCSDVAYAVPSNPQNTTGDLQSFFDNYTSNWYQNFNFSLQQIPCNTTSDAQYSLARNCTMCANAYKQWLCAVSIPRCDDLSRQPLWNTSQNPNLQPRNVAQQFLNNSYLPDSYLLTSYEPMNQAPTLPGTARYGQTYNWSFATNRSRNLQIDASIQPGPYNEVLPCEDLCYNLVQSCPASLGFGCPQPGKGLEQGYGVTGGSGNTCNWPGMLINFNGVGGLGAPVLRALALAVIVALVIVLS